MRKPAENKQGSGKNALEWLVFGLSLFLIAALLTFLAREALHTKTVPARLVARIGKVEHSEGWTHVPINLSNRGGSVASNVVVILNAKGTDREITGEVVIGHVPRHASHQGWVSFEGLILPEDISIRTIGYEE